MVDVGGKTKRPGGGKASSKSVQTANLVKTFKILNGISAPIRQSTKYYAQIPVKTLPPYLTPIFSRMSLVSSASVGKKHEQDLTFQSLT